METAPTTTPRTRRYRWALAWIPIGLHPKILGLKNRYCARPYSFSHLCTAVMTALLMVGLYCGTRNTLRELDRVAWPEAVAHSMLYGFSVGLFALICISAAVTGLSTLFMGRDVDTLLSAPTSDTSLLWGKALEVLISTTWMIIVFSIPPYVAFGQRLGAGASFFALGPIFITLFLVLAVLVGMTVAILCASILPARTGRNILAALFVIALGVIISVVNTRPEASWYTHVVQLSMESPTGSLLRHPLLPSTWLSGALVELTDTSLPFPTLYLGALGCTAMALWALLVLSFRRLYRRGYSRIHTQHGALFLFSRAGRSRRRVLSFRAAQTTRALATRELFTFGRDITHTIQLAMFLTICILYFINFQNIAAPLHVGTWALRAWDLIAIVSFLSLSSLIMLSICSRFVFPSVSLEGASLWILQIAPLTPTEILHTKYVTWAIPVGLICTVLFTSAGLALALEPVCVLVLAIAACIMTHGLVALGIGLGARFSRFEWEHPTELATSWGSLLFLLAGVITITLNFVPLCLTFGLYICIPSMFGSASNLVALFASGLGALLLINVIIARIAMGIGTSALTTVMAGSTT